jgi:hypothetical protein
MLNKHLLIIVALLSASFTNTAAIDTWQIFINKQVIFKGNAEMEETAVAIKIKTLKPQDCLIIKYFIDNPNPNWKRTFYINDSNDISVKTVEINKQSGSVSVNASVFKQLMDKKQPVFIYTTSLPKDPQKAAAVRVRRILLCKINWK